MNIDLAKLLIISNTAHHRQDGQIVGHAPTAREISQLASKFARVHHIGCLHEGRASAMMQPYSSERVRLIPIPPAGGDTLWEKAAVLKVAMKYVVTIMRELRELDGNDDVVHIRCPAPVSLIALALMTVVRFPRKRWVKYAGNWQPRRMDSFGYGFQRWWLKWNFSRASVTVNGYWPDQAAHIAAFVNPCLTRDEIAEGRKRNSSKLPLAPLRLIFVGQVNKKKGVGRALEIVKRLLDRKLEVAFDVIGDGPERAAFEVQAARDLGGKVTFHGWQPRSALGPFLSRAHLMLLPSDSEGWPKVLSEGMAYGVVPVASDVSSIPQYLRECGVGVTFNPHDIEGFVTAIVDYACHPMRWQLESERSMAGAVRFTYDAYLENVSRLLKLEQCAERP